MISRAIVVPGWVSFTGCQGVRSGDSDSVKGQDVIPRLDAGLIGRVFRKTFITTTPFYFCN
jgi:hypothetical protein